MRIDSPFCRRQFLHSAVAGSAIFPALVSELLAEDGRDKPGRSPEADPLAPKSPHFAPKAKSVIFLFMSGGVSHVDTFDPKPKLFADHGKQVRSTIRRRRADRATRSCS